MRLLRSIFTQVDNFIVDQLEKASPGVNQIRQTTIELMGISVACCILFILEIFAIQYFLSTANDFLKIVAIGMVISGTLASGGTILSLPLIQLKGIFLGYISCFHYILPGRRLREVKIEEYNHAVEVTRQARREEEQRRRHADRYPRDRTTYAVRPPRFHERIDPYDPTQVCLREKEALKNLPEYVRSRFNSSQSFIRYFGERIKDEKGNVNEYLLLFMLSLPKRKVLSVDALKDIMQSALQHTASIDLFKKNEIHLFLETEDMVAQFFEDWSEEKIKQLLTNRYTPNEYTTWVKMVMNKKGIDQEPKFLNLIINNEKRELTNPTLLNLENDQDYKFIVLKSRQDYERAKADFKNCVASYFGDKTQDIVIVYTKQDQPLACVAVDQSMRVSQIKAPYNENVSASPREDILAKIRILA